LLSHFSYNHEVCDLPEVITEQSKSWIIDRDDLE